jgi:DNA-binding PadR family transcriptional regulator
LEVGLGGLNFVVLNLKNNLKHEKNNQNRISNPNGTYYLIKDLLKYNFVESVDMAWHRTYQISELGKQVVKNNQ